LAEPLARKITETIAIPTIGIGASAACDGQVLVLEDMLGLSRTPKFVRRYGDLGPMIEAAIEGYCQGRALPRFSRSGACLWHEGEKLRRGRDMDWSHYSIPAMQLEARFGDRIVPAFCERPRSIWAMVSDAASRNPDGEALVCGVRADDVARSRATIRASRSGFT